MDTRQLPDQISIVGVFLLVVAILLAVFEVGYRFGRWWQEKTPDEKEGPTIMRVGSLLALMAFLLAVTASRGGGCESQPPDAVVPARPGF